MARTGTPARRSERRLRRWLALHRGALTHATRGRGDPACAELGVDAVHLFLLRAGAAMLLAPERADPRGALRDGLPVLAAAAETPGLGWLASAPPTPTEAAFERLGAPLLAELADVLFAELGEPPGEAALGAVHEALLADGSAPGAGGASRPPASARRRRGAHFTGQALARALVSRTLRPLLRGASRAEIVALRVCDPAMGGGALLCAALDEIAGALEQASPDAAGEPRGGQDARAAESRALAARCLSGVDVDPAAVAIARFELARRAAPLGRAGLDLREALIAGDALLGPPFPPGIGPLARPDAVDFPARFPGAFARTRPGFDACVGNPPWVAYAGRAAQPLEPELARWFAAASPAFHGYRTLHGLFVRRAPELVRTGGRLGLLLPTSVADLSGYAPTRAAHDALATVDEVLTDLGDGAFRGVFQPSMMLTSTRRSTPVGPPGAPRRDSASWRLSRNDLDPRSAALLARLDALPKVPRELFGERGYQSAGRDALHLRESDVPAPPFTVPLREGRDVREYELGAPRLHADPARLTGRLRPAQEWQRVAVLIRQTAREPVAARSDGLAFRNSLLAGFEAGGWTAAALVAYLNSAPVRWFHRMRHRDARQGMPQVKVGHLRALPDLPAPARARLEALVAAARAGAPGAALRAEIDAEVARALGCSPAEVALLPGGAPTGGAPRQPTDRPEVLHSPGGPPGGPGPPG